MQTPPSNIRPHPITESCVGDSVTRSLKNPSRTLEDTDPVNAHSVWTHWIIKPSKTGPTGNLIRKHSFVWFYIEL